MDVAIGSSEVLWLTNIFVHLSIMLIFVKVLKQSNYSIKRLAVRIFY